MHFDICKSEKKRAYTTKKGTFVVTPVYTRKERKNFRLIVNRKPFAKLERLLCGHCNSEENQRDTNVVYKTLYHLRPCYYQHMEEMRV